MTQNPTPKKKTVVLDDWTKRLLLLFIEVNKRGEIDKKKDFPDSFEMSDSFFTQIQNAESKFPKAEEKRLNAENALEERFGVNKHYMRTGEGPMFIRPAKPLETALDADIARLNFANKGEKRQLIESMKSMSQELSMVREEFEEYKRMNSDTKSDIPNA